MALLPPTVSQLYAFLRTDDVFEGDDAAAQQALMDSAALVELATGYSSYPASNPALSRLMRNAIMDMTQYLSVQRENAEESYTPFSGEHIGSYSYSKALTRAQYAIASKLGTGVYWFDQAVDYVLQEQMYGVDAPSWVTSEHVMPCSPEPPIFANTTWVPDFYGR